MKNLQLADKLGSSLNSGSISVNHFQMLKDKIKNCKDVQQELDKLEGDVTPWINWIPQSRIKQCKQYYFKA